MKNNNQNEIIKKAEVLTEALPYFSKYVNKTVIIKYGGNAMGDESVLKTILQDVAALKMVGVNPILIHGGGPEINAMLDKLNIKSEFKNGLRVTSKEAMGVVEMVLCGKINKQIVSTLNTLGAKAIGLSGKDSELIKVEKLDDGSGVDYGYVGRIIKINSDILNTLKQDYIPVIATVGVDKDGNSYNINADIAAGAIGGALAAERLLFLTDIDGIRKDEKDPKSLISHITVGEIKKMIKEGTISGGMIPKVNACCEAINSGVKSVEIMNGTIPHSILLELFTVEGVGTMVTN